MRLELKTKLERTFGKAKSVASGKLFSRQLTYLLDSCLVSLFQSLDKEFDLRDRMALIAVGGYGRMELSPYSDLDLLYLHDGSLSETTLTQVIGEINSYLFDNGKEVGHACRTIEESFQYLDSLQSFHAVLDSRFITGSDALYEDYKSKFLFCLPEELVKSYADYKIQFLKNRLIDQYEPLLLSEPNIKLDPLGLRDIQFMYWIEKTAKSEAKFQPGVFEFFLSGQSQPILEAYDFFLKTRAALHIICGRKNDRLDLSLQGEVAEFLGFGSRTELQSLERFMSYYYKSQKDVYFFLGVYLELKTSATAKDSVRIFSNPETLYEDTIDFFLECQKQDTEPSRIALNELRFASNFLEEDYKKSRPVINKFLTLVKNRKKIGHYLTLMHECNILGKLIPEFGACTNFPLFSYHHQYTVDEHTLLILRELDSIEDGNFEETEVLKVYRNSNKIEILILAILVHDAGKVKPGDHCQYGSELAMAISERFGLSEEDTELFRFLVAEHIDLSEISNKRDIYDSELIQRFANLFPDINWLNLLYILTIIDTKSVGKGVLTNWKKEILHTLYNLTKEQIQNKVNTETRSVSHFKIAEQYMIEKEKLNPSLVNHMLSYFKEFRPYSFLNYNTPRRIHQLYLNLVKWRSSGKFYEFFYENEPSFVTLIFLTKFHRDLLLIVSGCISSQNLNLVGMRVFETPEKDYILQVQITDELGSGSISSNQIEDLKNLVDSCLQGKMNIEELSSISWKWQERNPLPSRLVEETVRISHNPNENWSILEICFPDSFGLLYRILKAILSFPLQIIFVRIATSADFAYDSFYLQTQEGSAIESTELLMELKESILVAAQIKDSKGVFEIHF